MKKIMLPLLVVGAAWIAGAVELPKPVIELKLNEGVGTELKNSGTGTINARINFPERIAWADGRGDGVKALQLNNSGELRKQRGNLGSVVLPKAGGVIDITKPFTMSIWARPVAEAKNDETYTLFSTFTDDKGTGIMVSYAWGAYRAIFFDGEKNVNLRIHRSKASPKLGSWNHFAVTYDGRQVKLYLNGVMYESDQAAIQTPKNADWTVGGFLSGYAYAFEGMMADFRLYDCALSAEQVAAEYGGEVASSK